MELNWNFDEVVEKYWHEYLSENGYDAIPMSIKDEWDDYFYDYPSDGAKAAAKGRHYNPKSKKREDFDFEADYFVMDAFDEYDKALSINEKDKLAYLKEVLSDEETKKDFKAWYCEKVLNLN